MGKETIMGLVPWILSGFRAQGPGFGNLYLSLGAGLCSGVMGFDSCLCESEQTTFGG